jgi:trk system potassium uptake protein TrkA
VRKWEGKTLAELNLMNRYSVMILARKKADDKEYAFVPGPHEHMARGDSLILIGKQEAVLGLDP